MKKKILITAILFSGAALLNSCSDSETSTQLSIQKDCNDAQNQCSVQLVEATVEKTTNLLGKSQSKTIASQPAAAGQDLTWVINGDGTLAKSEDLVEAGVPPCAGTDCTLTENPSGFTFNIDPSNSISATGTATLNGTVYNLADIAPATVQTNENPVPTSVYACFMKNFDAYAQISASRSVPNNAATDESCQAAANSDSTWSLTWVNLTGSPVQVTVNSARVYTINDGVSYSWNAAKMDAYGSTTPPHLLNIHLR